MLTCGAIIFPKKIDNTFVINILCIYNTRLITNGNCMICWDDDKNKKLQNERNISFDQISEISLRREYISILENPSRPNQQIFVVKLNNYIHSVPFVIDAQSNIILKTAFPSRKLNKKYME